VYDRVYASKHTFAFICVNVYIYIDAHTQKHTANIKVFVKLYAGLTTVYM